MKVAISSDFFSALAKLPKTQFNKTIKLVEKFKTNPNGSGLNYEKLQSSTMYSLRVDLAYRCIVMKPQKGDVYILLWVDHHDEAYDWAKRHSCSVHPETGSVQILNTEYITQQQSLPGMVPSTNSFFGKFRDKDFLRLGVPQDLVSSVRLIDNELDLDELREALPEEAYEGLFYLLAGDSLEEVYKYLATEKVEEDIDTEDFIVALENDNSKRRFYVVDDSDIDLLSMLNAPLDKWRVFLHPTQRKLINRDWNGPVRVLGGAGTGKTVVAMHRAKWLAEKSLHSNEKILFTTFTKNLATDIQENLKKICSEVTLEKIEVKNLDRWVYEFLYKNGYKEKIVYSDRTDRIWGDALLVKSPNLELADSFFKEEWERVVQPQTVTTVKEYIKSSRVGRGTRLSRAQRKLVWEVFEEYRLLMAKEDYKEPSDAMRDARMLIESGHAEAGYAAIIVDEAQDLSVQGFKLLRALAPEKKNDLFIVGDAHQRIYGHKVILGRCGIKIVGRSRRLKLNYRTTDEIRKWAIELFNGQEVDDLDGGKDKQADYKSLYHGPVPDVQLCKDFASELTTIRETFDKLKTQDHNCRVCVVLRTNRLVEKYKQELNQSGYKTLVLTSANSDHIENEGIRLATMHRVKGLDFDHVIVASVNDGVVPLKISNQTSENLINEERLLKERSLLFVAATRAKKTLLITAYNKPSPFILNTAGESWF